MTVFSEGKVFGKMMHCSKVKDVSPVKDFSQVKVVDKAKDLLR